MPIYEFYCEDCHRIYRFLSRRINTTKSPACPRCERPRLARRVSTFAVSRGLSEPSGDPLDNIDDAALERALAELGGEAESLDENDPRQAAQLMRKLYGTLGLPTNEGVEEALRRMEGGEDPERIEEEMGDVFDDMGLGGEEGEEAEGGAGLKRRGARLRALRRKLPPPVERELYEM